MAVTGVVVGAIGSVGYFLIFLIFGTAVFATCAGCIGMGSFVANFAEQQVAAQPAADAITEYYNDNGELPDQSTAATLIAPITHEGSGFRFVAGTDGQTFYIEHPGDDGTWDTDDDWQTTWNATSDAVYDFDIPDENTPVQTPNQE